MAGLPTPVTKQRVADLGDLTWEPNLVHRLTIQISGNAPGTGTNTANGVQTTTGVPMTNPLDIVYDFIPATGKTASWSGIAMWRVAGGKVAQHWVEQDTLGLMQQLGAMPDGVYRAERQLDAVGAARSPSPPSAWRS